MELKLKGEIKETNYIVVMDTLFQYINTDFEKYDKSEAKDNTIIYRIDYSNTLLSHRKNLHISCHKTKTQYVAIVSEY